MATDFMPREQILDQAPVSKSQTQPTATGGAQGSSRLNPSVPAEGARQYLFYPRTVSPEKGRGLAELFKDIGEGVGDVVQGVDKFFKGSIDAQAHEKTDVLKDQTMMEQYGKLNPEGSNLPGQATTPPPDRVRNMLQGVNNLKTAADRGNVPHVYYEMQMNSIAKSLRAQYPGYRDYVDEVMSRINGGDSANKVINELFRANAERNTKASEDDKMYRSLYQTGIKEVTGFQAWFAKWQQEHGGAMPPLEAVAGKVNDELGGKAATTRQIEEYRLQKEQDQHTEEGTTRTAQAHLARLQRETFTEGGSLFGDVKGLQKLLDNAIAQSGNPSYHMSQQEFVQGQQFVNHISQKLRLQEQQILSDPLYDTLSDKGRKALRSMTDDLITNLTAAFGGKDDKEFKMGAAHMLANALHQIGMGDEYSIRQGSEVISMQAVLNKLLGANAVNIAVNFDKELGDSGANIQNRTLTDLKGILTKGLGRMATGSASLSQIVGQDLADKPPGSVAAIVNSTEKVLTAENVNPEGLKQLVMSIFKADANGETFLTTYHNGRPLIPSRDERNKIFATLTSPQAIENLKKLTDQGVLDDRHWDAIQGFVTKFVNDTMPEDIDQLRLINQPNRYYNVKFDPQQMRFLPAFNEGIKASAATTQPDQDESNAKKVSFYLNQHLRPLAQISEARGNPTEAITQQLDRFFSINGYSLQDMTVGAAPVNAEGKTDLGPLPIEEKKVRQVPLQ